jgi:hypothetical protein
MTIEYSRLIDVSNQLMDGHVKYSYGAKAALDKEPSDVTALDCSGFSRYLLYKASNTAIVLPNGSANQKVYCDNQKLTKVEYSTCGEKDGWLRIGFLAKNGSVPGHVWLILDSLTLESCGDKGPTRRPWDQGVLKKNIWACYKLAQTFTQHRSVPNIRYMEKRYYA